MVVKTLRKTIEIFEQVQNIVSEDPYSTKCEIVDTIDLSYERVLHNLHGEFSMKE